MMPVPDLIDLGLLRAYVAVVETRSFTEGGRRLRLSRSAAGKAIARLEGLLGVRLLQRTTRQVGVTAEGKLFYERAVQILQDLEEAQRVVSAGPGQPRGTLRITAPEAFGRQVVLPILCDFLDEWPDLTAEVSFTDRVVNLIEDGFDLAIRIGEIDAASDLITRVIARSSAHVAAAPCYVERYGHPERPEDLAQHRQLVTTTRHGLQPWLLTTPAEPDVAVPLRPRLVADNASALIEAAREGRGIVCLPAFLVEPEVEAGRLMRLLPQWSTGPITISAVYPSRRHLLPRVRRFIDHLSGGISERP